MNLKILPEIEENLFPLQPEELKFLEESILAEGVRDALVVWPKDGELILVDGHNRYKIAQKYDIPFQVVEKQFSDLDEVLEWIDFNQLGRRNLTDEQRTCILGKIYERRKKRHGGDRVSATYVQEQGVKFTPWSGSHATAKEIAEIANVTEKTVRNAAEFAKVVEEIKEDSCEVADRILKGEIKDAKSMIPTLKKKYSEIFNEVINELRDDKTKSIKDAIKNVNKKQKKEQAKIERTEKFNEEDRYTPIIYQGKFQDICQEFPDEYIDCIITDPPYPKEYLPLWSDLSLIASRILKPSGFCICYSGKYYLPEVIRRMSEYLEYYWQLILLHSGSLASVHPVKINTGYKPILVFQKPPRKPQAEYITDLIMGTGREKDLHEWQQAEGELSELLIKFTNVDDLILDPMAGSGTTGAACKNNSRRSILIDVNPI